MVFTVKILLIYFFPRTRTIPLLTILIVSLLCTRYVASYYFDIFNVSNELEFEFELQCHCHQRHPKCSTFKCNEDQPSFHFQQ